MSSSLAKEDYEQLAEFRYRIRKFLHFSEEAARAAGLTPHQHQLLLAIQGYPGRTYATPSELAQRLQIRHHSCVGLIQRCERQGLVERSSNPLDGRSVFVAVTESGLSILNELSHLHKEELARLGVQLRL
ncbi:MAG: MarR family winged helix-turn-helix transcriptional regulator [Bacilli bacterium]